MLGLITAGACGVSYGADVPLVFGNEDIAPFSVMQISKTPNENSSTTTVRVKRPTLCGKVTASAAPAGFTNRINPVFAGFYGSADFKFGSLSGGAQSPVQGIGYWNFRPDGLTIHSDAETLCYVLDAGGVRKLSAGLFTDSFDTSAPDATVTTSVVALPSFGNAYYTYYIDVRIPAQFSGMNYRVRDGFDSTVFAAGTSRHCPAQPIGATQCDVASMIYDNLDAPLVVPPGGVNQRYIVQRPLLASVQMPSDTSAAVTYAALFLADGAENTLGNNVSAGRGVLSDLAPTIIAQTTMVPHLAEGTGATNLSFVLTDDSVESGQSLLNASVTLDFNGNLVPATNLSCAQLETPQPGEVVRRTCRFDIPVFNADFATDPNPAAPGTYAPGVYASVLITATDPRGQQSTKSVPFHVVSGDNDTPSFLITPLVVEDPDKVSTLVCSLSAGLPFPAQCLGSIPNFMTGLKGGSTYAYDENATQLPFFAGVGSDNKLSCTSSSPSIFATQFPGGLQSPKAVISGTSVNLDYILSAQLGTADCTIYLGAFDPSAAFPYSQTVRAFRIRVVP
ncbi:MAG: hypothetical protein JNN30_00925 [Rhodanobacteraceae bacterium]|nr:hypothetical protein [Rhodanobacteraceae bacterium]